MSNLAGMTPTAIEMAMKQEQDQTIQALISNPSIPTEQRIGMARTLAGLASGGIVPLSPMDSSMAIGGHRQQYGHHPDTVARAKSKVELYTLEQRSRLVWDVKPVTIALGLGAVDNIVVPGDLYESKDAAIAEAVQRNRECVRRQAMQWSEDLTVAQLEGGTLDVAELDLLAQINRYLEVTK